MALTPERINELKEQAVSAWRAAGFEPMLQVFAAHAIETEVRKQDTALIRQLTDLVQAQHDYIMALPADVVASLPAMPGFDGDWADEIKAAARARLEGKP